MEEQRRAYAWWFHIKILASERDVARRLYGLRFPPSQTSQCLEAFKCILMALRISVQIIMELMPLPLPRCAPRSVENSTVHQENELEEATKKEIRRE